MNDTSIPGIPFTRSTRDNDHYKNTFAKLDKSEPTSSQYISAPLEHLHKQRKNTSTQKQLFQDPIMRQLAQDYQNVSNYKINSYQENKLDQKKNKKNKAHIISLHHHDSAPTQGETNFPNLNRYTLDQRNTYGQIAQHSWKRPEKLQNIVQPQHFEYIRQTDTLQDQDDLDESLVKSQSASNLRQINEIMAKKTSEYLKRQNKNPEKLKNSNIYYMDELEQHAILQNFRVSDLHFLNDQQFLPQSLAQHHLKLAKIPSKHSGKSQSNHPVFRDTIQYIDTAKYNIHERFLQHNQKGQKISQNSSFSSSPLTNVGEGYKGKYKRYKDRYMNMVQVVKQFQMLNETLIKDQRDNFRYYEDTIRHLEGMLTMKDKEIQQMSHLLTMSRVSQERTSRQLCSIEGRQLQIENQHLKRQLQTKDHQIRCLKQNIKSLDQSFQANQKYKQSQSKGFQKKNQLLKKEKQSLIKKIKSFEDLNKMYEQKMKEKEQRVNKLSEMNSELQQQILKLKNKIHSQETYDTDRDFRISFAPKIKNQFISSNDYSNNRTSLQSELKEKQSPQIQKYLACIDSQLQLIRNHMTSKTLIQDTNQEKNRNKLKENNMLESIYESDRLEASRQNKNQNPALKDLINVVDKLASFRVSMGV